MMHALIHAHDWSQASIGSPPDWPAPLRYAVRLMLDSPEPICLAWGPDLILLYNDAYRPLLGVKHPLAFAQPLARAWPDSWFVVEPFVRQTLSGRPVMQRDYPMKVDRGAGIEQAYFTFSYAPLRGDGGLIEGIYCTVHETTPSVIAAQQRDSAETELRELNHFLERSLLERTHERNQLWEVSRDLFLIADLDGRALSVNPAWERVLGYPQGEFLGRTTEWLEHSDD